MLYSLKEKGAEDNIPCSFAIYQPYKIMLEKLLTQEQLSKYSCPISRGYFDHYSVLWRSTSFDGVYLWRHPNRTHYYETLVSIVGHTPQWTDLTDRNLRLFVETVSERLCANSARTICAELKAIINEFRYEEDIPSQKYAKILTIAPEDSEAVYLSRKELQRIRSYNPLSPKEKVVKSIFLIQAFTGARRSDAERLSMANVNLGTNTLHYTSQKTHKSVECPFHAWLTEFLPQNVEEMSQRIKVGQVDFNHTLRFICRCCAINSPVTIFRHGKESTLPKWRFVSSHTARRSYATNLMLWGADINLIAKLMGHTDVQMTMRYIKDSPRIPKRVLDFFKS